MRSLLAVLLAAAACGGPPRDGAPAARSAAPASAPAVRLDTVAAGLEVPWALAFLPDGRILVTERVGRIRVIEGGRLREVPWATVGVRPTGEAGLMGIAAAPDFARSRAVYVVGTFRVGKSGLV